MNAMQGLQNVGFAIWPDKFWRRNLAVQGFRILETLIPSYLPVCLYVVFPPFLQYFPHFYKRNIFSLLPPSVVQMWTDQCGGGRGTGYVSYLTHHQRKIWYKISGRALWRVHMWGKNSKWTLAHQLPFFSVWGRFPSTVIHERLPSACPVYMQEKNQNKLKGIYVSEIL